MSPGDEANAEADEAGAEAEQRMRTCTHDHLPPFTPYRDGPLLRLVQSAGVYPDSKHFVDMPLKTEDVEVRQAWGVVGEPASLEYSVGVLRLAGTGIIRCAFTLMPDTTAPAPTYQAALTAARAQQEANGGVDGWRRCVAEYFDDPGADLEPWSDPDAPEAKGLPQWIREMPAGNLKDLCTHIHGLWPLLTRRRRQGGVAHARSSLLERRHDVMVVAGGRFRETYYWDSYWIVKGLIASDMTHRAVQVVENLLHDVDTYGFVRFMEIALLFCCH